MAHPFFDTNEFPAERLDAIALHTMLMNAYRSRAIVDIIYRRVQAGLPGLPEPASAEVLWDNVLRNLSARYLLQKLCTMLLDDASLGDPNKDIVRAVVNAVPGAAIAGGSTRMPSEHVVDRRSFREFLSLIEPDATRPKVLLVRGNEQTGKSHSRHLFFDMAREQGAETVFIYPEVITTVDRALRRLLNTLDPAMQIPDGYSTRFADYQAMCFELLRVAINEKKRLWIAVDDLGPKSDNAPVLSDDVREFFESFCLLMRDPGFGKHFRLLLMHYPQYPTTSTVPTGWKDGFWRIDSTCDTDVTREHVLAYVTEWLGYRGLAGRVVQAEVDGLVNDVIAAADTPVRPEDAALPRLERLNQKLSKAIEGLKARSR